MLGTLAPQIAWGGGRGAGPVNRDDWSQTALARCSSAARSPSFSITDGAAGGGPANHRPVLRGRHLCGSIRWVCWRSRM